MSDGLVMLEIGERHTCVCGAVTVGRIGPRGGQTWLYRKDGVLRCRRDCQVARDLDDMDAGRGEHEAALGEEMFG